MSESFKEIAEKNNKRYAKTKKYVDWAYLVAVAFIIAGRAMVLTRQSNDTFVTVIVYTGSALLFLIGAYRLFFQFFKNWKKALLGLSVVVFSFIFSELSSSASEFPVVALAIVGAMDVSANSILWAGIAGNLVMISNNVIVALFFSGNDRYAYDVNNFFYLGDNYLSFPTFNNFSSTDFAAHYFWILAAYLWIRGKKITWGEILALGAFDAMIYSMTGSNTSLVGISLLLIIVMAYKIWLSWAAKKNLNTDLQGENRNNLSDSLSKGVNTVFGFCCKYSFAIFAAVTIVLTVLYNSGNPVFYRLNNLLHMRLGLGHKGIVEYGIHLFATRVRVYGSFASIDGYYNFIDCSYVSILVRSGIIPLLFFVGSMTAIQLRHKKYLFGAVLLAVCALSCVEEHHMAEIPYNFFILMLFADFRLDDKIGSSDSVKTQNQKIVNVLAFALCGVFSISTVLINYPRFKTVKELDALDNKASEIYCAVQDNLNSLVENGIWQLKTSPMNSYMYGDLVKEPEDFYAVTGTAWNEYTKEPKVHSFYAVYYDNQIPSDNGILNLLISDEVKAMVGDGSIVVEYDVQSGRVYAVWYSDNPGCYVVEDTGSRNYTRMARLNNDEAKEGYSTGGKNV